MRTIADSYIEEGFNKGMIQNIEQGIEKTAINMLKSNLDLKLICQVTGLLMHKITKLKATL